MDETEDTVRQPTQFDCDMTHAGRNLWLVKVPISMASAFDAAEEGSEIGTLRVYEATADDEPPRVAIRVAPNVQQTAQQLTGSTVPSKLDLVLNKEAPCMAILSQNKEGLESVLEGSVGSKYDCRYRQGARYDAFAANRQRQATTYQQSREAQKKDIRRFKPTMGVRKPRNTLKNIRMPVEELKHKLFDLFGKHEYYKLDQLHALTQQPKTFLRQVLGEIAEINKTNPHKNMWHLKADFKHY
eukprot:m.16533 g.16533  ORF g.16533 m.16533 type:complete len:242 (+) comp5272_c0_seq1:158-883(+)